MREYSQPLPAKYLLSRCQLEIQAPNTAVALGVWSTRVAWVFSKPKTLAHLGNTTHNLADDACLTGNDPIMFPLIETANIMN